MQECEQKEAASGEGSAEAKQRKMKRFRATKANANVVVISMGSLSKETTMMTGDAVFCHGCQAIISVVSALVDTEDGKKSWTW